MDAAKINAMVASAYNRAAQGNADYRAAYPSGMRPADASGMPAADKRALLLWYASQGGSELYGMADIRAALQELPQ